MKRARFITVLVAVALMLAACQNPEMNPLTRLEPGQWDASVWNTALWE